MKKSKREQQLEFIVRETLWMARRYAHGRMTVVPWAYNKAAAVAIELGLMDEKSMDTANIHEGDLVDSTVWAKDGGFGWPDELIEKHGLHMPKEITGEETDA